MTRFARARGSASSNERLPEEATPWAQLRAGLVGRDGNPEEDVGDFTVAGGDDEEPDRVPEPVGNASMSDDDGSEDDTDQQEDAALPVATAVASSVVEEPSETSVKKKKNKNRSSKCLQCRQKGHLKMECPTLSEDRRKELQELVRLKQERKGHGTGRKKNKNKNNKAKSDNNAGGDESVEDKVSVSIEEPPKKKAKKVKKRPERKDLTGQVVQEGEDLFQGFRVTKEDAQRLKSLSAKLRAEGVKGKELAEALKPERRRAEKALARFHKKLCFRCRQPGHALANCPKTDLKDSKNAGRDLQVGHCFKCGSDQHTSKECVSKAKGGDAFAFAKCFVCGQNGHLAKACPDNPRGIYPKGGGCRFCGSVEHLKSECKRKMEKDARTEVRVATLATARGLEEQEPLSQPPRIKAQPASRPTKRVVTF
jgi:zinc finger CCHC domain-containing protein 9